jgi:hypothetical protein
VSPGFAFDFHRARDEFVGQFSKLYLRVSIADSVSQFTTRVGLTSQVDRTSGHGRLRAALLVKLGCNAKAETSIRHSEPASIGQSESRSISPVDLIASS